MSRVLETERLILSRLTIDDAPFMLMLFNDPSFIDNICDKNIRTLEQAQQHIRDAPLESYKKHGYGPYLVQLKQTDELIGICGLYKREEFDFADIGYAFLPQFTGQGFACEAAQATLKYALNQLKLTKVLAITSLKNSRSEKLLNKIGLKLQGTIAYGDDQEQTKLFSTH